MHKDQGIEKKLSIAYENVINSCAYDFLIYDHFDFHSNKEKINS